MSEHRDAAQQLLKAASTEVEGIEVIASLVQIALTHAVLAVEHRIAELVAEQRKTRELMAGVYDPKSR